jgi:hypothetical protein
MSKTTSTQREKQWKELYERTKRALEPYGADDEAGGDYFVIDLVPNDNVQMVEMHRLHMLRPHIIKSLQRLLVDFPDWEMEVFVISPEEKVILDPDSGLVLQADGIIDALDRSSLPEKYRHFEYEGSRPAPKDFKR